MGFNCVFIRFPKAKLADLLFSLPFFYVFQITFVPWVFTMFSKTSLLDLLFLFRVLLDLPK